VNAPIVRPPAGQTEKPRPEEGRFVTGSTMRHVVVMASTGSIGLVAIFAVDLLSLLYISWLGDPSLTAGVGLATIVLFLATSINVGLMIAIGALVARSLGARDRDGARRLAASTLIWTAVAATFAVIVLMPLVPWILGLLGARGETANAAQLFLMIVLPSNVVMAIGMGMSGVLRAVGDARRAMYLTLAGAVATAILDPILIFGMGWGVTGAALGMVMSRFVFVGIGYYYIRHIHDLLARPSWNDIFGHARPMFGIAIPAVLTSVATPIAAGFLAGVIARYGDEAIAGNAIIERLTPVAFGGLFALSGAVGPILGQNWGAERFDRMRAVLRDSMLVTGGYILVTWLVLVLARDAIVAAFGASGDTASLVIFFCLVSGPMWFFNGLLFVSNASFNNLGFPLYSTAFNWGRATLGTMPFALLGAHYGGPEGAILGVGIGSVVFGTAAIVTAFWAMRRLERTAGGTSQG
jgi:putative MATE family efflux protein